ncbi:GNAT family N-acetyltransferase [Echinicola vietnamensis]|uniref:GNAT family N-acetyltransferase n=1 Tax=Echinicola vietnamensis TaxID=390884 RepID=UPI0002FD90BA
MFVDKNNRGRKIGEQLMEYVRKEAELNHCTQIKWTVALWNLNGQRFYESLGTSENKEWLNYEWNI